MFRACEPEKCDRHPLSRARVLDRFAPEAKLLTELLIDRLPIANPHLALDATGQDLPAFGEELKEAVRHDSACSGRFPL
jgi:hypothetical protein